MDTGEQDIVHMCGFGGVRKGNYFGGELVERTEVEVRMKNLKKRKGASKDEVAEEVIELEIV